MQQGTFEKQIFIQTDTAIVVGVVANYNQHHKIHPLIVQVEQAQEAPADVQRFFITDQLQWGLLNSRSNIVRILFLLRRLLSILRHINHRTHSWRT